jgi:hypothetical protein
MPALPSALPLPKKYTRFTFLPAFFGEADLDAFLDESALRRDLPRDATATPLFLAMIENLLSTSVLEAGEV